MSRCLGRPTVKRLIEAITAKPQTAKQLARLFSVEPITIKRLAAKLPQVKHVKAPTHRGPGRRAYVYSLSEEKETWPRTSPN